MRRKQQRQQGERNVMTSQTKHYVDLSDIVAVRGECCRCRATISIPTSASPLRLEGLRHCPSCNEPWAQVGASSIESTIQKFVDQFNELQQAVKRVRGITISKEGGGFMLTLEVKDEAAKSIASVSGHASGEKD